MDQELFGRFKKCAVEVLSVDESKVVSLYANFCRVTGTPEELIVDFALNPRVTIFANGFEAPVTLTERRPDIQ